MSGQDPDEEIVCESFRRRLRVMDWLFAPFDLLELALLVATAVFAIMYVIQAW